MLTQFFWTWAWRPSFLLKFRSARSKKENIFFRNHSSGSRFFEMSKAVILQADEQSRSAAMQVRNHLYDMCIPKSGDEQTLENILWRLVLALSKPIFVHNIHSAAFFECHKIYVLLHRYKLKDLTIFSPKYWSHFVINTYSVLLTFGLTLPTFDKFENTLHVVKHLMYPVLSFSNFCIYMYLLLFW